MVLALKFEVSALFAFNVGFWIVLTVKQKFDYSKVNKKKINYNNNINNF